MAGQRARYYDAKVGRCISEDLIGFAVGDYNLSRYVANSPTHATDPSGLESFWAPGSDMIGEGSGIFTDSVNGIRTLSHVNLGMGINFGLGDGKWSDPIMRGFGSYRYDQRLHTISVSNGMWASDGNTSGPVSEMCQLGGIWESGGGCNTVTGTFSIWDHKRSVKSHAGALSVGLKPTRSGLYEVKITYNLQVSRKACPAGTAQGTFTAHGNGGVEFEMTAPWTDNPNLKTSQSRMGYVIVQVFAEADRYTEVALWNPTMAVQTGSGRTGFGEYAAKASIGITSVRLMDKQR